MPNTRINSILNTRTINRTNSSKLKEADISLYNNYKESFNSGKIKINLRNSNNIIEINLMNYLTLECYDENDTFISTGIVYFGCGGTNTYSILGLIDMDSLFQDYNLSINDIIDITLIMYSRRGLQDEAFEIYGIDSFYYSTSMNVDEYIIPLFDIYNTDNDFTFFITPLSSFNDYDIIYDLDSNVYIERSVYPVELLIITPPTKLTYNETEYFNPSGMIIKLKYSNNTLEVINNYTYYPTTRLFIGNNQVTISYQNLYAYQAITVNETLINLRIDEYPRLNYLVGEVFDTTSLVLTGIYPNSFERRILDYTYSPTLELTTSIDRITFTKGSKSIDLNINVRYLYDFLTKTYNNSYISLFESIIFNPLTKSHIFNLNLLDSNSNLLDIDIDLIYRSNSTFGHNLIFNTLGMNFKLSIDERIIKHEALFHSYKHIDKIGDIHEFISFDIDSEPKRYYDSYNANIVLEVDSINNKYFLKYDDYTKVFNSDGYLINIIDKFSKKIIFTYNSSNKITSIYKENYNTTNYAFTYKSNGLISTITENINGNPYKKITFFYNSQNNLIKLSKDYIGSNQNISINSYAYLYDTTTNNLTLILDKKNNNAYQFFYDNNHEIFKVEVGSTTNEITTTINGTTFNTFFNERDYKKIDDIIHPSYGSFLGVFDIDANSIIECQISSKFNLNSYVFDKNNEITSKFIIEDGIYYTTNLREGDLIIVEGATSGGINNSSLLNNSSRTISLNPFSSIPSSSIDSNKTYYFNLSFFLKINYTGYTASLSKAKLKIYNNNTLINAFYSRINEKALGVYQFVSIDFKVSGNHIQNRDNLTFKLDILDYENHILNATLSDIRLKENDFRNLYLSETNLDEIINRDGSVECKIFDDYINDPTHTNVITYSLDSFRITKLDILRYFLKRTTLDDSFTPFDFVFDNSRKRIANVNNILLDIDSTRITIASNLISLLPPLRLDTYNLYSTKRNYLEYVYESSNYLKKFTEEEDYILKDSSNNFYIKRLSKEYEYDSYDRVIKKEESEKDIENITTTTKRYNKTIYTYNQDNDLVEVNTYINTLSHGTLTSSRIQYSYDENKNLTRKRIHKGKITPPISLIETDRIDYSYDSYNNKTSETYSKYNGVSTVIPIKKHDFTYDNAYEYIKTIIFKVKDDVGENYFEVGRSNNTYNLPINESNTNLSELSNAYTKYYFKDNYKTNLSSVLLSLGASSSIIDSTPLYEEKIDDNENSTYKTSTFYNDINISETYKKRSTYDKYNRLKKVSDSINDASFTEKVTFSYESSRGINGSLFEIDDDFIDVVTDIDSKSISRSNGFRIDLDSNEYKYSLGSISYIKRIYTDLNGNIIRLDNKASGDTNLMYLFSSTSLYDGQNRKIRSNGFIDILYSYNYNDGVANISYERYNENTNFLSINYTYDIYGNITSESINIKYNSLLSSITKTSEFEYDKLSRITMDNSYILGDCPINYEYSQTTGKRTKIYESPITDNNIIYNLKGRITSFEGIELSYDNYGNITEIGALKELIYTRGTLLETYIDNDYTNPKKLSFIYDYNGVRYRKLILDSNDNIIKTITYYYHDNKLLFERIHNESDGSSTTNDIIISYIYDDTGIIGAIYKTCKYRYIKNILGDIILIVNDNLDIIAEYNYTAYGLYSTNNLSNSNTIDYEFVEYNPFTYRSYYHDHESNLYYLINRYYSPEIEMFITPDSFNYLDPSTLYGLDLYTYCGNNPVMYVDSEGNIAFCILCGLILGGAGLIGGGIYSGIKSYDNGRRGWKLIGSIAIGSLIGGALGFCAGTLVGAGFAGFTAGQFGASVSQVCVGVKTLYALGKNIGIMASIYGVCDNFMNAINNYTHVFWSGYYTQEAGNNLANDVGGKTIEMTKLGNYISGIENANEKGYWELASRLFANQVKYGDTAYVILNYPLRDGNIWETVEQPMLKEVVEIIEIILGG